jgi:hypothetical protein
VSDPKPKLAGWAPLAEIVASIAVVLSLIYLATEVRQNTRAIQGAAFQELIHAADASLLAVAGDPGLADILVRGDADVTTLDATELAQYRALVRVYWRDFETGFLQRQRNLLGDDEWEVYSNLICSSRVRFESTWYLHEPFLSSAFVAFTEAC